MPLKIYKLLKSVPRASACEFIVPRALACEFIVPRALACEFIVPRALACEFKEENILQQVNVRSQAKARATFLGKPAK
jgi:hypothetical protein